MDADNHKHKSSSEGQNENLNNAENESFDERERIHVDLNNLTTSRKTSSEVLREGMNNAEPFPEALNTKSDLTTEDYNDLNPQGSEKVVEQGNENTPMPVDFTVRFPNPALDKNGKAETENSDSEAKSEH